MTAKNLNLMLGGTLVLLFLAAAAIGAVWTPYNPLGINLSGKLLPPGAEHWLGTDEFGRDVLSRLMAAAGTSVVISLLTVSLSIGAGVVLGLISGYARGAVDRSIMTLNDALLAFPSMLMALALLSITRLALTEFQSRFEGGHHGRSAVTTMQ